MNYTTQLANHIRQVYLSGNWTASNLKSQLESVTLKMAKTKVKDLNTILALTYHIHYYINGTMQVLKGKELTIRDKFSYDHPDLQNEDEWQEFKENIWQEATEYASLIERLDDSILEKHFVDEKYGSYFRNFLGIIEHTNYHLGQIALIKKLV